MYMIGHVSKTAKKNQVNY
uniref:Uncharacterized protein n=1 Tax=Rhizophora mucronata TaxID=61149 RepID=A0A2P2J261_RHIMU